MGCLLVPVSRDGAVVDKYLAAGVCTGQVSKPCALAALPDGGLVVREIDGLQLFIGLTLRFTWVAACVTVTRGR